MSNTLIDQLYSASDCAYIKLLYKEDPSCRTALREALVDKIILDKDKFLSYKPIDVLYIICLGSDFASSDDECHRIAITIFQYFNKPQNILPSLISDIGLQFANKTLISLSFFYQALEKKWKYHAAPSPLYYRQASKATFARFGQEDIALHHEKWEKFIGEYFV